MSQSGRDTTYTYLMANKGSNYSQNRVLHYSGLTVLVDNKSQTLTINSDMLKRIQNETILTQAECTTGHASACICYPVYVAAMDILLQAHTPVTPGVRQVADHS